MRVTMKQHTIRGIPPEVEKAIAEEARKKGLSYNKALISLLRKAVGCEEKRKEHHDLDEFCGIWAQSPELDVTPFLEEQRRIDESLWK